MHRPTALCRCSEAGLYKTLKRDPTVLLSFRYGRLFKYFVDNVPLMRFCYLFVGHGIKSAKSLGITLRGKEIITLFFVVFL